MYNIVTTEFENNLFIKVFYELEKVVVGIDIFQLKDDQILQLSPGVLTPKDEENLQSGLYDRVPTVDELGIIQEVFRSRSGYTLQKTTEYISQVGGVILLGLYEIAGRFFAHTKHDNTSFPRLAEVWVSTPELPITLEEVPKEFLPYVIEKITGKMLDKKNKGVTLQIGNGLFVRVRRQSSTAFATVVMLESSKEGVIERISAPLGFALSLTNNSWLVMPEDKLFTPKIHEEMQKAFDHVSNELALVLKEFSE